MYRCKHNPAIKAMPTYPFFREYDAQRTDIHPFIHALYRHMAVTPLVPIDTGVLASLSIGCGNQRASLLGIHLLKQATEYVHRGETGQCLLNSLLASERDYNATNERRKNKGLPPLE
jgi:hypothetical protein